MTEQPKPEGTFDRLRQSGRRKGPLSFADLSATIVDAQKQTGFVDTLSVEAPTASDGQVSDSRPAETAPDREDRLQVPAVQTALDPHKSIPVFISEAASASTSTEFDRAPSHSAPRKGRVRAPIVQCNLKISEELRDALHLQALRERRAIADLVTEVMTAYLSAQGTFDRLR
ncbi:MAG: hypothetical protein ACRCUE_16995 [Bosea sp. (in: a-proteobacteria)]